MQPSIELDLTRFTVVPDHQPAVVVEQHLFGDAAKMPEGTLQTGKERLGSWRTHSGCLPGRAPPAKPRST